MSYELFSVLDINAQTASCGCAETFITEEDDSGKPVRRYLAEIKWHDCDYIKNRNNNIWLADKAARAEVAHLSGTDPWGPAYTRAFSLQMDKLSVGI